MIRESVVPFSTLFNISVYEFLPNCCWQYLIFSCGCTLGCPWNLSMKKWCKSEIMHRTKNSMLAFPHFNASILEVSLIRLGIKLLMIMHSVSMSSFYSFSNY